MRRLTDTKSGAVVKPMYSAVQAWNADESLLILYHTGEQGAGHSLYDGRTYRYLRELDIRPADLEQVYWDTHDPDVFYYVDNYYEGSRRVLIRYHVGAGRREVMHSFACSGAVAADSHGFTSWDSRVLGLLCRGDHGERYAFVYDIVSGSEGPHRPSSAGGAPLSAPSGTLFYLHGKVLGRDLQEVRALDVGEPTEHSSLGRLANGHDTYNEASFDGRHVGSLVTHDMTDGSVRVVIGRATGFSHQPSGTHVSALAFQRPGWVALSSVGAPPHTPRTLDQEIYLANTDPGSTRVCRVAHHRSWGGEGHLGYWAEPHVVISPTGTRLLFGSDWGGGTSVDTYVVELPSFSGGSGVSASKQ